MRVHFLMENCLKRMIKHKKASTLCSHLMLAYIKRAELIFV
jgi:hypothetical protein